ncbi:hypothetical protein E2I00_016745, partial [Balaenoptera physalus]
SLSQPVLTQPTSLSTSLGASARLTCTLSRSWAQSGLTQEGSVSGSVGQEVTLSCTGNGNNVGANTVNWYQQISHGAPKTAMLTGSLPSGIPDRFSGSTSVNTASLTISGLQPEDKADYYCSTWDDSISGNTAHLTHGELRQKPTPSPLRSFCGGICKGGSSAPRSL